MSMIMLSINNLKKWIKKKRFSDDMKKKKITKCYLFLIQRHKHVKNERICDWDRFYEWNPEQITLYPTLKFRVKRIIMLFGHGCFPSLLYLYTGQSFVSKHRPWVITQIPGS